MQNALNEVISCITDSYEYKECLRLKNIMSNNSDVTDLVRDIKHLQRQYVRSNYDDDLGKKLKQLEKALLNIPIYAVYMKYLECVNNNISYVKDELNSYFYEVLNDGNN